MDTTLIRSTDNRDLNDMERYRSATIEALKTEIRRLQIEVARLKDVKWTHNDEGVQPTTIV